MRLRDTLLPLCCGAVLAGCSAIDADSEFRGETDHVTVTETTAVTTDATTDATTDKGTETGTGDEAGETAQEDTGDVGCTRTIGYWRTHNVFRRNASQQIPWPISENTMLCGQTWLTWLNTPREGSAFVILAVQFIGASLNAAAGADVPDDVAEALEAAATLLAACDTDISPSEDSTYTELAELLDNYNNGDEGVPECD